MGVKTHQISTDSPKAEVGEIDTRAPFKSVKAAVSLFGEVAFSVDKSSPRKTKHQPALAENPLAKETELHLAQKELNKLKEQLQNAETTRAEALTDLDSARKTVEVLNSELNTINNLKESALKSTETAKDQTKKLEKVISVDCGGKDDTWKQELNSAREQYAVTISELDAAKQELRSMRKDFDSSVESKIFAFHQEAEAKNFSGASIEKSTQLRKDIQAAKESLIHVNLATNQAQEEESKIIFEKDVRQRSYILALEESKKNLESLRTRVDPELNKNLEAKLRELEYVASVAIELDGAKGVLKKVAEEEVSLKSLVESLKLEMDSVEKEHSELKEKDTKIESFSVKLQDELERCKAELEAALVSESNSSSASDDMKSTLQKLSGESETTFQETETTRKKTEEVRSKAKEAKNVLTEAEKKLQVALTGAAEAKEAEARALDQIKKLSGKRITISSGEYDALVRKVEEFEKLAEIEADSAVAQSTGVKASEGETVRRLEAARKEMEDMVTATEEAMRQAEMAEAARRALEGEMMKLREREQNSKSADGQSPVMTGSPTMKMAERSEAHVKASKKTLLPSLSGIFQRKKNRADGAQPSYLPGEKPE